MLRRLAGFVGLSLLALVSFAQAQSYARDAVDYRAGIVVIDSAQTATTKQPINYTPHVWFNLDSNLGVKPAGWNIYNPRATTQMTQAVYDRWLGIATDLGGATPDLNSNISKAGAAYWEVRLGTVSDQQLSQYDVLLLSAYGFTNLNSVERDKLRKFVDQGGILWVDLASTTSFANSQVNTFPLPVQTSNTFGGAALTDADIFSPLMMNPYTLSLSNLEQMRVDTGSFAAPIDLASVSVGALSPIESWVESDYFMHFSTVATSNGRPTVLVGKLGDGFVVVTSSEYAMALNRVPAGGGAYNANNHFVGIPPTFDRTSQLAAKFAINLLHLTSGYSQAGGGARSPNSNPITLSPPLLANVRATDGGVGPNQSPVLYKGLLVVSSGDHISVYDAKPNSDLDGDGNPDDGIQDSSLGQNYDLLWTSQSLGGQISSPTCAEIPGAAVKDQIFVVGSNGIVYAFDAFQLLNGVIQPNTGAGPIYTIKPPAPASFGGGPNDGPYPPTFHDGLLYIADVTGGGTPTGRVWVADPLAQDNIRTAGTNAWSVGASGFQTLPEPSASPTIGYIPVQDNSGGYDRVLYIPGQPTSVAGPTGNSSITSLWLGVRGESPPPNSLTFDPGSLTVVTRAARQGLQVYNETSFPPLSNQGARSLGIKITVLYPNGDPFTNSDMAQYFTGTVTSTNGQLTFPLNQPLPSNVGIRLDYSIDWGTGNASQTSQIIRGQLNLPDTEDPSGTPTGSKRRIIGNLAMSPRGTIYCVSTTQNKTDTNYAGGTYYAFREDIGRGGFRLLTRYDLFPSHTITLNQALSVNYPPALSDNDPIRTFMPSYMQGPFARLTFIGAPSVRNGVVYVTAAGRKIDPSTVWSAFVPYSILMAFKAEPEAPEIRIGNVPDSFSLRQPDMTRSANKQVPSSFNELGSGQFTYDRGEGVIRFDNLMATNRGPVSNAFSTSQPVIIRRANQPDELIEPDATGNKWTPLLWYAVMHGVDATGGAFTSGGAVFVPGQSLLPNFGDLLSSGTIKLSGMVEAWKANVSANDDWLKQDPLRPGNYQLNQVSTTLSPNSDLLWPQISNLTDFTDYLVRVRQTKLGSTTAYGLIGGEGVLGAWGDQGVYTFSRSDFLVADTGRLSRIDADGNIRWSSDAASSTGSVDVATVGTVKPLINPTRAYSVGENDTVVVDPGSNRISMLDLTGRELRSISDFKVDPANIPDGYQANEPLTLNGPRDVAFFKTYELNGTQYWYHYLIADTGNKRLIELVDKYVLNANRQIVDVLTVGGVRQIGVLIWHSPANFSGKAFDYASIARVFEPISGRYYYCAGISSTMPTRANTGLDSPVAAPTQERESASGNGGIVIFDPIDASKNVIINQVLVPEVFANTYWDYSTNTFNSLDRQARFKKLSNLTSVTSRVVYDQATGTHIAIMFTDSTGVYEITQQAGGDWQVRWMLTNEAYRALRRLKTGGPFPSNPVDLRANYARRLDDGDIVIVNGYLGKTRANVDFNGEVLQLNGDFNDDPAETGFSFAKQNLGFELSMIVFQLPPIQGARGLVLPVFADRR